jgi:hypothetical protein
LFYPLKGGYTFVSKKKGGHRGANDPRKATDAAMTDYLTVYGHRNIIRRQAQQKRRYVGRFGWRPGSYLPLMQM